MQAVRQTHRREVPRLEGRVRHVAIVSHKTSALDRERVGRQGDLTAPQQIDEMGRRPLDDIRKQAFVVFYPSDSGTVGGNSHRMRRSRQTCRFGVQCRARGAEARGRGSIRPLLRSPTCMSALSFSVSIPEASQGSFLPENTTTPPDSTVLGQSLVRSTSVPLRLHRAASPFTQSSHR